DHLDDGIVRFGARVCKEGMAHAAIGELDKFFSQLDGGRVSLVRERVVEGKLLHLAVRCLDQPGFVKTHGDAPQPRHALYVLLALIVVYVDAFAALNDAWADLLVLDR